MHPPTGEAAFIPSTCNYFLEGGVQTTSTSLALALPKICQPNSKGY